MIDYKKCPFCRRSIKKTRRKYEEIGPLINPFPRPNDPNSTCVQFRRCWHCGIWFARNKHFSTIDMDSVEKMMERIAPHAAGQSGPNNRQ